MVVGLIFAISMAAAKGQDAARQTRLQAIANALGGQAAGSGLNCTRHGVIVGYAFVTRGAGSTSESWTEVDVTLPRGYPISLRVVRGQPAVHAVRSGAVIDVEVGDPAFDDVFLIEAAPSDVVKQLLDPEARAFLAGYSQGVLTTETVGDRTVLRFAVPGWDETITGATAAIEGLSRMAGRFRDAYAAADAGVPMRSAGSPYRPELDDRPAHDAAAVRTSELEALATLKERRAADARASGVAILVIIGVIFLTGLMAAATHSCSGEYHGDDY